MTLCHPPPPHPLAVLLLPLLLLLLLAARAAADPPFAARITATHLHISTGAIIPLATLRTALPHLPPAHFPRALYLPSSTGDLVNLAATRRLRAHILAPVETQLRPDADHPAIRVREDELQLPDFRDGPFVRTGSGYTFVYHSATRELLAAWGPGLSLAPVGHADHPGVFVNVVEGGRSLNVSTETRPSGTCPATHDGRGPSRVTGSLRRPRFPTDPASFPPRAAPAGRARRAPASADLDSATAENGDTEVNGTVRLNDSLMRLHDFGFVVSYGHDVCRLYGSSKRTNEVVYAMYRAARDIYSTTSIVLRIQLIHAICRKDKDPYIRPASINECSEDATDCSRSSRLLEFYRHYWVTYQEKGRRDAVYVISGYDDGSPAIGAAYVGAACNLEFGYGWIQMANPVVLAHEVGHTLGAHHATDGVMKPFLDLSATTPPRLSSDSVSSINEFTSSLYSSWCLARWDRYYQYGDSTLVGLKMGNTIVEGTDVTFGDWASGGKRRVDLYTLHAGDQGKVRDNLYYSITVDVRVTAESKYEYDMWRGLYKVPNTQSFHKVGGGIAFGNIKSKWSRDLVIVYQKTARWLEYKVGFGLDNAGMIDDSDWTNAFEIPISLYAPNAVQSVGAAVADTRGRGKTDLVVAFIMDVRGVDYGKYLIGYDLGPDGRVRGGWSALYPIIGWFGSDTGDISVELFDTSGSGMQDLIVYNNEKVMTEWRGIFRVGRDLGHEGNVTGLWTTALPAPNNPLVSVMPAVTGGIALTPLRQGGKSRMTTVMMHSVTFRQTPAVVSYLEFAFDVVKAAQKAAKSSFIENVVRDPSRMCDRCYNASVSAVAKCERRFVDCEATEHSFAIETDSKDVASSSTEGAGAVARQAAGTHDDTLYCTGFHQLFVERESDPCRQDVGTEEIVAEGTSERIQRELSALLGSDDVTVTYEMQTSESKEPPTSHLSGPSRKPLSIRITMTTARATRRKIITAALRRIRSSRDYRDVFKVEPARFIVKSVGGRTYVVLLRFSSVFHANFYKDDLLLSYGKE